MKAKLSLITVIGFSFLMIYLYNFFTPHFSDDLNFIFLVREANSLMDLKIMAFDEYMQWNPRIIGNFNAYLSAKMSKSLFNLINSGFFVLLVFLIYYNVVFDLKKRWNIPLFLITLFFFWRYAVEFGDTILWLAGAANYLWPMTIMLAFISYYRYLLIIDKTTHKWLVFPVLFILGILAGWSNENTSGGTILLILIFTGIKIYEMKKAQNKIIKIEMIIAITGALTGFIALLLSPGAYKRVSHFEENYSGIVGLFSRLHKCLISIDELFFELFVIFIILTILVIVIKRKKKQVYKQVLPFFITGIATSFALILIPEPSIRAYFGAGVFLVIASLKSFVLLIESDDTKATVLKYICLSVLALWLLFDYQANLVNVARVYREENERIAIMEEAKRNGLNEVVVPQLRQEFNNRYSSIYNHDMSEDYEFWINCYYRNFFNIYKISAIPRPDWDKLYGSK